MAVSGPFVAGNASRNNQFSFTLTVDQNIPAGAFCWLLAGSNVADTATLTVTDSAGNAWDFRSFIQLPNTGATFILYVSKLTNALPIGSTITVNSTDRANWGATLYYHTGANGSIFGQGTEYFTGTAPTMSVRGLPGMALFGAIAVQGPNNDVFTPDPNWGADVTSGVGTTNATIHASGRLATVDQLYTYAPILGTARKSYIFIASFS